MFVSYFHEIQPLDNLIKVIVLTNKGMSRCDGLAKPLTQLSDVLSDVRILIYRFSGRGVNATSQNIYFLKDFDKDFKYHKGYLAKTIQLFAIDAQSHVGRTRTSDRKNCFLAIKIYNQ